MLTNSDAFFIITDAFAMGTSTQLNFQEPVSIFLLSTQNDNERLQSSILLFSCPTLWLTVFEMSAKLIKKIYDAILKSLYPLKTVVPAAAAAAGKWI